MRLCHITKMQLAGLFTWAYNEHICEQYAIWWVQTGPSAASPRNVPKPCFTVVANAAGKNTRLWCVAFRDSARLHLLRFGTICSNRLKHSGNYRIKQIQDVWDQDLEENTGTEREEVTPKWRKVVYRKLANKRISSDRNFSFATRFRFMQVL